VPNVLKSGILKLLEPSGPVQACNGIALLFYQYKGKWSAVLDRVMNLRVPEKPSLYRLQGLQEVEDPHDGGNFVSPTHRPPLIPKRYHWYSFLLEVESTPGPQFGHKD